MTVASEIIRQIRWELQDMREVFPEPYVVNIKQLTPNAYLIGEMDYNKNITYGIEINGVIVAKTNSDYSAPKMLVAILQ